MHYWWWVLNRRMKRRFYPFSCSVWRGAEDHKSCLLVHIRVNTAHYYHRLKTRPCASKRSWSLFCKQPCCFRWEVTHMWKKRLCVADVNPTFMLSWCALGASTLQSIYAHTLIGSGFSTGDYILHIACILCISRWITPCQGLIGLDWQVLSPWDAHIMAGLTYLTCLFILLY